MSYLNKFIKISSLIFAITIMMSCENEIQIEIKFEDEKLVAYALLEEGQIPRIFFFQSISPLEEINVLMLGNVEAALIDEENNRYSLYFVNSYEDFFYQEFYSDTTMLIESGKTYRLEASHPTLGEISAITTVPNKIGDGEISFTYQKNVVINRSNLNGVDIGLNENPNILRVSFEKTHANQEFLRVGQLEINSKYFSSENDEYPITESYNGAILFSSLPTVNILSSFTLVDIRNLPLGVHEFIFQVPAFIEWVDNPQQFELNVNEFSMFVGTMNQSARNYFISLDQNTISDPFQEPTPIYNNIENGFGLMGGTAVKFIIEIEEIRR